MPPSAAQSGGSVLAGAAAFTTSCRLDRKWAFFPLAADGGPVRPVYDRPIPRPPSRRQSPLTAVGQCGAVAPKLRSNFRLGDITSQKLDAALRVLWALCVYLTDQKFFFRLPNEIRIRAPVTLRPPPHRRP
jgi:hypothetical protein